MAKSKSKAIFSVADGAGGMMEMKDRRFEKGDWPISLTSRSSKNRRTVGRAI
jgi:hypothetical protein